MAEKVLNTRILLKYDTYTNWTTNNPVLKKGEVAFATIETNADGVKNAPSVLIKVGDGTSAYNSLKFVSGLAADVHSWAKAENKPTYTANEIEGLDTFIANEDTDTQYRILKVDDYNYKLQSKAKGAEDTTFADVSEIVIPKYDDTEVKADIAALEELVGETAVATQIANAIAALDLANTYEAKGTAATEAGKVQTALDEYKEEVETTLGNYATKAEAQGYANAKDAAIAEAKTAATNAQNDVDALETVVDGKADKATTLAGYGITDAYTKTEVENAIKASEYDDTALTERVTTVEGKVTILIGDDANKSVRTIASEELAAQLVPEGAKESLDTLAEIAAWIQNHPDDASAMNAAIVALQNQLKGIDAGEGTVKKYVDDAIAALKIGDYAKAADLTALAGRVTTLEEKVEGLETEVADFADITKTGNVNDLVQTEGDVLIFDCGNSAV